MQPNNEKKRILLPSLRQWKYQIRSQIQLKAEKFRTSRMGCSRCLSRKHERYINIRKDIQMNHQKRLTTCLLVTEKNVF